MNHFCKSSSFGYFVGQNEPFSKISLLRIFLRLKTTLFLEISQLWIQLLKKHKKILRKNFIFLSLSDWHASLTVYYNCYHYYYSLFLYYSYYFPLFNCFTFLPLTKGGKKSFFKTEIEWGHELYYRLEIRDNWNERNGTERRRSCRMRAIGSIDSSVFLSLMRNEKTRRNTSCGL